jgi:hypothetical protein
MTMSDSTTHSLTCFLSSAFRDSIIAEEVRNVLDGLGVDVRKSEDLPPGSDVASAIVNAVLSADFVCIIMAAGVNNSTAWYEAGIATGSRRPILVVAEEKAIDQMPFTLFSAPIVRYQREAPAVLRDNITAYVRQVQPIAAQLKVSWDRVDVTGARVVGETDPDVVPRETDALGELVAHFNTEGILVARYARIGPNKRVDALLGFPSLGDDFNTVIIEVKRHRIDQGSDIEQVLDYISAAGARLAMLVYVEPRDIESELKVFGHVGIILVSANELLQWDYARFSGELTRLRNLVVHSS